jgi:phage virion morphogenesis protein
MMTGVSLSVDIEDFRPLQRQIDGLLKRTRELRPLMEIIGAYLDYATKRRFLRGEAPDGARWLPSLRVQLGGGQTMVDSGRLRDSYGWRATDTSVEEGTNAIYAGILHTGGKIEAKGKALHFKIGGRDVFAKSVTIPARPALGLNADDISEIGSIVNDYIAGGLQ